MRVLENKRLKRISIIDKDIIDIDTIDIFFRFYFLSMCMWFYCCLIR